MSKYSASYRGIGDMLRSPMMEAEMRRRAELVRRLAVATAPVYVPRNARRRGRGSDDHSGRYKASFQVSSGIRPGRAPRACGRVTNSAPEARFVEYGNRNTPKHRTLGNALVAAHG